MVSKNGSLGRESEEHDIHFLSNNQMNTSLTQLQQLQNSYVDQHAMIKHQQHLDQLASRRSSNGFSDFKDYDLKSRESKYRRWTPKMDQYLIKLLSDIVHSYPKDAEVEMTKKAWAYLCGQLRAANPETVYSTYTKYSCQQHLLNVIHHRYKIWYVLMVHQKSHANVQTAYSYRWNPDLGSFQIIDNTTNSLILDERQVKSLLYSESLSLPSLSAFNRGNLIVNDFFLTDNLRYMSVYHNEILPLLIRLDPKYADGLENVYSEIPKFNYHEQNNEYFKKLVPPKITKQSQAVANGKKKRPRDLSIISMETPEEDSVDPALKRRVEKKQDDDHPIDFESALASAAIAAIQSPPVVNSSSSVPFYVKDRKWFYKLVSLNEGGLLSIEEVLQVCEGVRDGKIPTFMLNVLDMDYYPTRNSVIDELPDEEIAKRIRDFMLPMVYNS